MLANGHQAGGRQREVDRVVDGDQRRIGAPVRRRLQCAHRETQAVESGERPRRADARLGKRQGEVQRRRGGERLDDQAERLEAPRGEGVDREQEGQAPHGAERQHGAALERLGFQVEGREARGEEREAVQDVDAHGGRPVVELEAHRRHRARRRAADAVELVAVKRSRRRRPGQPLELVAGSHGRAVHGSQLVAIRHVGRHAGPTRTPERRHHEVPPGDESRERPPHVLQRPRDGDRAEQARDRRDGGEQPGVSRPPEATEHGETRRC